MAWKGLLQLDEIAHPRGPKDSGQEPTEGFRRKLERSGRLWRGRLDLAIERRGRLIGQIQARTRPEQSLPTGVFEIGLALYRAADRGKGYGTEAVALLTDWLFEDAGAARVQVGTGATNAAMRGVLERLGFVLEGRLRDYGAARDGSREDGAMYGMTRLDWEPLSLSSMRFELGIRGDA